MTASVKSVLTEVRAAARQEPRGTERGRKLIYLADQLSSGLREESDEQDLARTALQILRQTS